MAYQAALSAFGSQGSQSARGSSGHWGNRGSSGFLGATGADGGQVSHAPISSFAPFGAFKPYDWAKDAKKTACGSLDMSATRRPSVDSPSQMQVRMQLFFKTL